MKFSWNPWNNFIGWDSNELSVRDFVEMSDGILSKLPKECVQNRWKLSNLLMGFCEYSWTNSVESLNSTNSLKKICRNCKGDNVKIADTILMKALKGFYPYRWEEIAFEWSYTAPRKLSVKFLESTLERNSVTVWKYVERLLENLLKRFFQNAKFWSNFTKKMRSNFLKTFLQNHCKFCRSS